MGDVEGAPYRDAERYGDEAAGADHAIPTGEALVARGVVTREQLREALEIQVNRGGRMGEILFALTRHEKTEICDFVAARLGVEWVRPDRLEIAPEVLAMVSSRVASHYEIVPVDVVGDAVAVATADPANRAALDEIALLINRPVEPRLAMPVHIADAVRRCYGIGAGAIDQMQSRESAELVIESGDHLALDDPSNEASIVTFVNEIIREAYRLDATDIHFEPGDGSFRIRYRIDGMLEEIPVPSGVKRYQSAIVSRVKVAARLNIAEQRLPQDGRIQARLGDQTFDIRVSVLPTPLGEAIDLRLLKRTSVLLDLEDLGYASHNLATLLEAARRPNGIVLVTGPTGSGKTTTLYALLQKVSTIDRKIVTIEDPIEYHLPGMIQMQTHDAIGFTFATALRSILRHDPDIVLVGEIRDAETAEIAIRMAMTGHLVFSTLHTNDAAATIARLIDMEQEPYLLASTISCVVAQRLIRLLCPHCRVESRPTAEALEPFAKLGLDTDNAAARVRGEPAFLSAVGCDACRGAGYAGRTGIHEVFPIDEDFRSLILERAPASRFRALSREKSIPLMSHDGWRRVLAGETTIDEVLRITQTGEV